MCVAVWLCVCVAVCVDARATVSDSLLPQFVEVFCLVSIVLGIVEHVGRVIAVKLRIYRRSRATVRLPLALTSWHTSHGAYLACLVPTQLFDLVLVLTAAILYTLQRVDALRDVAHMQQVGRAYRGVRCAAQR